MAYFRCGGGSNKKGIYITVACGSAYQGKTITCTKGSTSKSAVCGSNNKVNFFFSENEVSTLPATFTISNNLNSETKSVTASIYGWYKTGFTVALVPTMTSATTPSGLAFGSANYGSDYPWHAFDGSISTQFQSNGNANSRYVGYKFDNRVIVDQVKLIGFNVGSGYSGIKNFIVQGSNDGITYTNVSTTLTTTNDYANWQTFSFANSTSYQYYRIEIVDNHSPSSIYRGVTELQFYGYEE